MSTASEAQTDRQTHTEYENITSIAYVNFLSPSTHNSGGSRISRRGGVDLVGGGVDSQSGYVSKILYVKTKELGPLGGHAPGAPPKSANA